MGRRIIVRRIEKTVGLALKRSQNGLYQSREYMKMVSVEHGVKKCTCRESNPGLIRGRDTSYHLTTSAHSYYHRDHLSWAQTSEPSHQKWRSSLSRCHQGGESLLVGTWSSSVIKRWHIRTSRGHLHVKVSSVSLKEKSWHLRIASICLALLFSSLLCSALLFSAL